MSCDPRSRGWCLTVNNPHEDDYAFVYHLSFEFEEYVRMINESSTKPKTPSSLFGLSYFVCGNEVGKSGTRHFQMFIYFSSLKSFKQVKDMFPSAHIEKLRAQPDQAAKYCKKDKDYIECGSPPLSFDQRVKKGNEVWTEMYQHSLELVRTGQYSQLPMSVTNHIRALEYRVMRETEEQRDLSPIEGDFENIWIWGRAGVGKSVLARQIAPGCYPKPPNKWWDYYKNEADVLIDDFDKRHEDQIQDLKRWTDRWSFIGEFKGSSTMLRPRRFIITSNYHPRDIWRAWEDLDPILRRFKIIELKKRADGTVEQFEDPPYEVPVV